MLYRVAGETPDRVKKALLSPSPQLEAEVQQDTRFFDNFINPHHKLTGSYGTMKRMQKG